MGHLFAAVIEHHSRVRDVTYFDPAAHNLCPSITTKPKILQLSLDYGGHSPGKGEKMKWSGGGRRKLQAEN
jgi:hypothetical protein